MVHTHLFVGILLTIATAEVIQGHVVDMMYHSSVNFTCNKPLGSNLDLSSYQTGDLRRVWILPSDELVEAGTAKPDSRVDVLENGALLHIRRVDDADFGWYYCLIYVYPLQSYFLQKHGLNVGGPYFGDLYELKYKDMVVTGLVAGAVCFVSMGLLCFVYNRQQSRLDKEAEEDKARSAGYINEEGINDKPATSTEKPMSQYQNVAFVYDDEDQGSQKPVTQHTTVAYAEEKPSSKKGPAPTPPEPQELQNFAADSAVDAGVGGAGVDTRTKL